MAKHWAVWVRLIIQYDLYSSKYGILYICIVYIDCFCHGWFPALELLLGSMLI